MVALQSIDLLQPMDLEREDSEEEEEEDEEATLPVAAEVQAEASSEQSLLKVWRGSWVNWHPMRRWLNRHLGSRVSLSRSKASHRSKIREGTPGLPTNWTTSWTNNRRGAMAIIKETNKLSFEGTNDTCNYGTCAQTLPVTKSTPESTVRFYNRFVVKASLSWRRPVLRPRLLSLQWASILCWYPRYTSKAKGLLWHRLHEGWRYLLRMYIWVEPMKELVLRGIFEGVRMLESFAILDISN